MSWDLAAELVRDFGPPNASGTFLVGMLDTPEEADEAQVFGRMLMCLRRAVGSLLLPIRIDEHSVAIEGDCGTAEILPGMRVAIARVDGSDRPTSIGSARKPSQAEYAAWIATDPLAQAGHDVEAWERAGFPRRTIAAWRNAATTLARTAEPIGHAQALTACVPWAVNGFTSTEALEWHAATQDLESGATSARAARRWTELSFTAEEASQWAGTWPRPEESPEGAWAFRHLGWRPMEVWLLNEFIDPRSNPDWERSRRAFAHSDPGDSLDRARAGLTPYHEDLFGLGDEVQVESSPDALERAFATRTPIDPYKAMLINHHIWLAFGGELPDDLPFRYQHLPDLHDSRAGAAAQPIGVKSEAGRTFGKALCPNSGGEGRMLERDGWDEWQVECPTCGSKWAGGPTEPLPSH